MTKIVNLRQRISHDNREYRPGECAHRHINLDSRGGIVTCVTCKATLTPFWALTMLSGQYELALENIARMTKRLALADERIAALSAGTAAARSRSKDAVKSDDRGLD